MVRKSLSKIALWILGLSEGETLIFKISLGLMSRLLSEDYIQVSALESDTGMGVVQKTSL